MRIPICDFVENYQNMKCSRLHMPGHKGHVFLGCEPKDITEIHGADVLHGAEGIIRESQQNAAMLFDTGHTFYSTEGSSLCIKVMIDALLQRAKRTGRWQKTARPTILAARNVHRAMIDACALLDVDIIFLQGEDSHLCTAVVSPQRLRQTLQELCGEGGNVAEALQGLSDKQENVADAPQGLSDQKKNVVDASQRLSGNVIGVYITSPDYLGNIQDISGLSSVCREYDLPLAVDNAHGAYLNFLQEPLHPMRLGADICCDSAHKTLPVLTGGAYLHIAKQASGFSIERVPRAMALFGSTSPSYLILQSLDYCNHYLADNYPERLQSFIKRFQQCGETLRQYGFVLTGQEPLKLTIYAEAMHLDGERLAEQMRKAQIECEYADHQYVVLMGTPENTEQDLARIEQFARTFDGIQKVGSRTQMTEGRERYLYPMWEDHAKETMSEVNTKRSQPALRACTIREAVLAECEEIAVSQAEGRICGAETVSCPPAVPIAVCGEIITQDMIQQFEEYGITKVSVLVKG